MTREKTGCGVCVGATRIDELAVTNAEPETPRRSLHTQLWARWAVLTIVSEKAA